MKAMSPAIFLVSICFSVLAGSALAENISSKVIQLQVQLARSQASPGPIDGVMGANTQSAIMGFQSMHGIEPTGKLDERTRSMLPSTTDSPAIVEYEITKEDVDGPFVDRIPDEMLQMAELERLSYTNTIELLSEKFRMDPDLLRQLNREKNFDKAGELIRVAHVAQVKLEAKVNRIEVDRTQEVVRAYDGEDRLVAVYPATIGSDDTPSPRGEYKVTSVARNPTYTYDPKKLDFAGVRAKAAFTIANDRRAPYASSSMLRNLSDRALEPWFGGEQIQGAARCHIQGQQSEEISHGTLNSRS